jgi:hypothetical protein
MDKILTTKKNMNRLSELARLYNTDKGIDFHGYTRIYHKYFKKLRDSPITLLEIGVGGYTDTHKGGESLRMWSDYFRNAYIHGVDVYEKNLTGRFSTHKGDQTDKDFLSSLIGSIGNPDIIIDDGSHINVKTRQTFEILFPLLAAGGTYVIEDTQTAYIKEEYGGSEDPCDYKVDTIVNYLLGLVHQVNLNPTLSPRSIHFYRNIVFINK